MKPIQLPRAVEWFRPLSSTSSTSSGKADVYDWVRMWCRRGHAGRVMDFPWFLPTLNSHKFEMIWQKEDKLFFSPQKKGHFAVLVKTSWFKRKVLFCWFYFDGKTPPPLDLWYQAFLGRWHRQLVRRAGNWCRDAIANKDMLMIFYYTKRGCFRNMLLQLWFVSSGYTV